MDELNDLAAASDPKDFHQEKSPQVITSPHLRQIFVYFALLTLLLGLGDGLSNLPVTFFLKEKLHLGPEKMAVFGALTQIPTYVGFLFGFLRDRWRPFGKGDRGYMMLTMPVIGGLYLYLSLSPLTYARILWVSLLGGVVGSILGAAVSGLTVSVAQKWRMTGRLVALNGVITVVPGVLSQLGGGWLTDHTTPQFVFRICAILYFGVTTIAFWSPRAVFEGQPEHHPATEETPWAAARRILSHRPIWPALLIVMLYEFTPGWDTPLFFYLTNKVRLSAEQFGELSAIGVVVSALASALYGVLCKRFPLRRLLWAGNILGALSGPVYLLIHNFGEAIGIYILVSVLLGLASGSIYDLLMRSYPAGLEGTGSALIGSGIALVVSVSDIFGSWLYDKGGFGLALAITTIFTALILPVLLLVPRRLIETRDGETQESGPRDLAPEMT